MSASTSRTSRKSRARVPDARTFGLRQPAAGNDVLDGLEEFLSSGVFDGIGVNAGPPVIKLRQELVARGCTEESAKQVASFAHVMSKMEVFGPIAGIVHRTTVSQGGSDPGVSAEQIEDAMLAAGYPVRLSVNPAVNRARLAERQQQASDQQPCPDTRDGQQAQLKQQEQQQHEPKQRSTQTALSLSNPASAATPAATASIMDGDAASSSIEAATTAKTDSSEKERCRKCHVKEDKMFRCSLCMAVRYCSKECQAADWKVHKKECKQLQAQQQ